MAFIHEPFCPLISIFVLPFQFFVLPFKFYAHTTKNGKRELPMFQGLLPSAKVFGHFGY